MEKKNIESLFKEKSENYSSEVRPKLWGKLEKRMDDHYAITAPTKMVHLAWMRYAAAFVLLLGAVFLLTRLDNQDNNGIVSQFTLEELSSSADEVQLYEDMASFSQKHYRTLINPVKKKKQTL